MGRRPESRLPGRLHARATSSCSPAAGDGGGRGPGGSPAGCVRPGAPPRCPASPRRARACPSSWHGGSRLFPTLPPAPCRVGTAPHVGGRPARGAEPRDLAADGPSHSSPRASFVCRPRAQGAAGAVPGGGRSLPPRPGARSFREERLVALLEGKPASRGVRRHSAALGLLLGAGGGSGERETAAEVTVTGGGGDGDGGRWQGPPRVPSFRGLSHGRERAPPGPAWAAGADAPPLDSGHPGRTDLGRHSAA